MFKVGDKVKLKKEDGIYEVKRFVCQRDYYELESITGQYPYLEEYENKLELVEDDMKIKIEKWYDLNGKENSEYRIDMEPCCSKGLETLQVRKLNKTFMAEIRYNQAPKDIVLNFLKDFGFSVEFTEPIKLTKEEWHFVRAFKDGWVARDRSDKANIFFGKPFKQGNFWVHNGGYKFSVMFGMFQFITWESEPWSIESLREIGCEEDT